MNLRKWWRSCGGGLAGLLIPAIPLGSAAAEAPPEIIRSVADGAWSATKTWENGRVPAKGDRVQIRKGHDVLYDVSSEAAIRAIHVAGALRFATDRDTRLDVGLIRIEAGDEWKEGVIHCHDVPLAPSSANPLPTLEIGSSEQPVAAGHTALVRLVHFEGDDPECLPGIVCIAGRMDIHGAPLRRTWVKLDQAANPGEDRLFLAEPVDDWRVGDRLVVTATYRQRPFAGNGPDHVTERPASEEVIIEKFAPDTMARRGESPRKLVYLKQPLTLPHAANDGYAAEVANLSRNVVIESATPEGVRGHTMYHRYSKGSISYAEFRNLGKKGLLGRYPIHFHLTGDTMRGTSVIGASIWSSDNRWIVLHGTQHVIVRDCIGYRSVGHGFYLENGQEVYNLFDRNLAIQALVGDPLPDQALPYDRNDGAGFWWANSRNVFTRNVAVECDQHGFRFEVEKSDTFDPLMDVPQPDGRMTKQDLRTIPFLRFDDNEIHAQRRFAMNLGGVRGMTYQGYGDQPESIGGDVDGVGPGQHHPFIIRRLKVWDSHWSFHGASPSVLVDGMDLHDGQYGIWRSVMSRHEYRNLRFGNFASSPLYFPMGAKDEEQIRLEEGKPTFPQITPVDDLPPATVITHVRRGDGKLLVRGATIDNGEIVRVTVNGLEAKAERSDFSEWSIVLDEADAKELKAVSEDKDGNKEVMPHVISLEADRVGGSLK